MTNSILRQMGEIFLPPEIMPTSQRLKILLVSPECSPYANVGGLSRVVGYLSRALCELGHDARVFFPKFGTIGEEKYKMDVVYKSLQIPTGSEKPSHLICNVKGHQAPGLAPAYLLENREYYELRANVYGYKDDHIRWGLLSRGALEFLKVSDWVPDVIHCNDWEVGHVPNFLRTMFDNHPTLMPIATLFTLHNLGYQGNFDHKNVSELNFDDGKSPIAGLFSDQFLWQNFLRRGIVYADVINTVSKTYAKEILKPEFGEGLDKLLTEVRGKLFGVLNGIDYEEFNPATDKLLAANFSVYSLSKRVENKLALQEEFDLPQDKEIPILAFEGRIDVQKGVDLILEVLDHLLADFEVQFVIVGGGDPNFVNGFRELAKKFPKKVGAHLVFDYSLPRLVFAGTDFLLHPSRFEPCGIVPMEVMRYGAIPIVRATGGLNDTVENFDPAKNTGTGFVFKEFNNWSFYAQVIRALEIYRQKPLFTELQKRAMQVDNSWASRAKEYVKLYAKAIHLRTKLLEEEGRVEE